MSEMIERVARAMSEASIPFGLGKQERTGWLEWDAMDEISRRHWRRYARAAIEAIREPSEAMILALGKPLGDFCDCGAIGNRKLMESAYNEAIDAALNPSP